ncbi:MAG: hypothetical protein ACOYJL_09220 [Tractidigestivibacter sp.]|jgi:hypothetical protein|uniref:hypothetical protein n=1 Tax=Tractidigestivibacter sp. TaxID=2847320 RepID=UPI003D8FD335
MDLWVVIGACFGLAASVPFFIVLARASRKNEAPMAAGAGCVLVSFLVLTLAIAAVSRKDPSAVLAFGTSSSITLLVSVSVSGFLAWKKSRT